MTGTSFHIEVDDAAVKSAISAMITRGENLAPVHDAIGAAMVLSTQLRFERETGPDGVPWPKSLRAALQGGLTLTDTARLKQSVTYNVFSAGVEWGTNVIYGAIHQLGGAAGRGHAVNLPPRPFLGIDDPDRDTIRKEYSDYIFDPSLFGAPS